MGLKISQAKIMLAIINGIEQAQLFYENCSGGYWLWTAPEYLININIAQKLTALDGAKYVTWSTNVHQTLRASQDRFFGAPKKKLRHRGRFGLVFWWGNDSPRCAIEVKNQVSSYSQILKDIDRLESLIDRNKDNSSFQFGVMAFYTSCIGSKQKSAAEIITTRINRLLEQTKNHVSAKIAVTMHHGEITSRGDSARVAVCFVLKCKV